MFEQLFIDSRGENADITAVFIELYNIKRVMASIYYLQLQGFIERSYKPIVDALVKIKGLTYFTNERDIQASETANSSPKFTKFTTKYLRHDIVF